MKRLPGVIIASMLILLLATPLGAQEKSVRDVQGAY